MSGAAVTMDLHPRPEPGQPRPWTFPVGERGALGTGMRVLRCHRPGQQVVAVEIALDLPLDAEPSGRDGIAAIMADALSQGTSEHSAEEFAAELERAGATLRAHADFLGTRLSLEVPVSRLARALTLVTEALSQPAFDPSEVDRLVRNRLDGIPIELANPARRAAWQLSRELFPATARMSRPRRGTAETVAQIDAGGVRDFYTAQVRAGTATVVVVGDLTGVDLDGILDSTLGQWTDVPNAPQPLPPAPATDIGRVVIVNRPGAVQTQLLIGRTGPDRHAAEWPALVLGVYCLGGTLTSRLDRVLREEKGYTYGVRAFQQVLRSPASDGHGVATGLAGTSLFAISGSVDTGSTGPALADLWGVLNGVADGGLTDAERDVSVQNLVGVAPLRYETPAPVASTLADQVEQHLPDDFQAGLYQRLATTGTAEATAAVVSALPADRLVTILVGDAEEIRQPVSDLGIGQVSVVEHAVGPATA